MRLGTRNSRAPSGVDLNSDGRLDFEESLLVKVLARGERDLAAQTEVARHLGPAQIEVAIFQAQFLVHLARHFRVVHRERQHVGDIEHFEFLDHHFDFAGGDFGIVRAGGTLADLAGGADDAFAAQRRGALEKFLGQIGRVKNGLGAAFAVADVNEDEAAEVAPGMDPAGQGDYLPNVCRAQFVAMMRAFHLIRWEGRRAADPNFRDSNMPSLPVKRARILAGNTLKFKDKFA